MNKIPHDRKIFRLHMTNIAGLGAIRLLQSIIPNFTSLSSFKITEAYIPQGNEVIDPDIFEAETKVVHYKRYLPRAISRFLECTIFGGMFDGDTPLLVMGDIPLRCKGTQIVFLQNKLLLDQFSQLKVLDSFKYRILKYIFERNLSYVDSFIVQTNTMKKQLLTLYPKLRGCVYVVAQPVPDWLMRANFRRTVNVYDDLIGLNLFYPSAFYPHKNHLLLSGIKDPDVWPINKLTLTIDEYVNPLPKAGWIECVGRLNADMVIDEYRSTDALLFLSQVESYGFPIIEAMWLGIPIICPDLDYARDLCGDEAIYFDPLLSDSLLSAVEELNCRLGSGWWPDWNKQLKTFPKSWISVANEMSEICFLQHRH